MMTLRDVVLNLYLPLLIQDTAVMVSSFTYGLRSGATWPFLVLVDVIAVATDVVIFFIPSHFLSARLHDLLIKRFQRRYDQGMRYVVRFGAFRTAAFLGFVMPSVLAMVIVGLLRMSFQRAAAGLFVGSAVYVVIPLLLALPLAPIIPHSLLPYLPWFGPALGVVVVLVALYRVRYAPRNKQAES